MMRAAVLAATLACLVLAGCGGDEEDGAPEPQAEMEYLTVIQAGGGSIEGDGPELEVSLRDVAPEVAGFSQRPERIAGSVPTDEYVDTWAQDYEGDPPNAALTILDGGEESTLVLELQDPERRSGDELTFSAKPVDDPGDALEPLDGGDAPAPGSFGAASLFIDDGGLMQLVAYGAQDV